MVVDHIRSNADANYGYDAAKDVFTDMMKSGIIDPKKVARTALENAISISGMFLTTEAVIVDIPKPEAHSHAAPDMGGMGGMY